MLLPFFAGKKVRATQRGLVIDAPRLGLVDSSEPPQKGGLKKVNDALSALL
jgi:hypothetical protein